MKIKSRKWDALQPGDKITDEKLFAIRNEI